MMIVMSTINQFLGMWENFEPEVICFLWNLGEILSLRSIVYAQPPARSVGGQNRAKAEGGARREGGGEAGAEIAPRASGLLHEGLTGFLLPGLTSGASGVDCAQRLPGADRRIKEFVGRC